MAGGGMGAPAPTSTGQQSGQPTGFSGLFGDGSTPGTIMQGTGLPMMSPTQQAPVGAPPPADLSTSATPANTSAAPSLQFGTAGTGTAGEQQASPMVQQMQAQVPMQNPYARPMPQSMYRPQMMQQPQQQYGGLQALLNSLVNRYQQPQQRYSQMPQYRSNALGYRPNLAQAQQSLSRTATTKAEAQAAAEAAARAKLEAERGISGEDADFLRWQRQQYNLARDSFNSGG